MRIAVVSDIHGNRTAFEAVLADLRQTSPDLIFHGGDLADAGASPAEIVDRVRDLGWQGVVGNTDEMLTTPDSLSAFAEQSPQWQALFAVIAEMATATREVLGEDRLVWLRSLPRAQTRPPMALVHASPESAWRAPCRNQAMPSWSRFTDHSASRSLSTAIFIARIFAALGE
jgi:Icc-related predicted phosphoesterase